MKGQWRQGELLSIRLDAERCRAFILIQRGYPWIRAAGEGCQAATTFSFT